MADFIFKKSPKINEQTFFHSVNCFVLKKIQILWEKLSVKKNIGSGDQKPRWHQLKKILTKFRLKNHLAGFLETTF
jgi:hypothetical protein